MKRISLFVLPILAVVVHSLAAVGAEPSKVLRVAVYGDNRSGWRDDGVHRRLLERIRTDDPDLILHTGDIVYRGDRKEHWDTFFRDGSELFASVPLRPSVGNHDLSRDGKFASFFPFGEKGATYYAFRQGPASFIALDTTIDFSPGSPQYRFLSEALEIAHGHRPLIVYFHHPPFNAGKHGDDQRVKDHLVPLFEKYRVTLVLAGHDHNYQRFAPVHGVSYLVTGGGGGPLYRVNERQDLLNHGVFHHYLLLKIDKTKIQVSVKNLNGDTVESYEIAF